MADETRGHRNETTMGLDEFLNALPEDESAPINFASLSTLSGLSSPEAEEFGQLWLEWSSERVLEIVDRMVSLCEEQPDVEFEAVYKQGLSHTDSRVRLSSLKGLEESDDRTLLKPITAMMTLDPSEEVRVAAAESLCHLAALAQTERLAPRDGKTLSDALYEVLEDETEIEAVKLKALEAVSVFGGDRIKGGRHIRYHDRAQLPDLHVTLLNEVGVPIENVGVSTTKLPLDPLSLNGFV